MPVLLMLVRRHGLRLRTAGPVPWRPIVLLLVGSLGAQVLLNGPAVVLTAVVSRAALADVAAFQALFQLVRIPLFLAVPLRSTLVPVMIRFLHQRDAHERVSILRRGAVGVSLLIVLGAGTGWLLGPGLVHLIFGDRYDASTQMAAVLAAGTVAYLGLLVLSQAFVADGRHGTVGRSWGTGVLVATVVFALVPGAISAAGYSFASGCLAGLVTAASAALRASRPTAAPRAPAIWC